MKRSPISVAVPLHPHGKAGAVLALHGHGGTGSEIVRGESLYWYGRALAQGFTLAVNSGKVRQLRIERQ